MIIFTWLLPIVFTGLFWGFVAFVSGDFYWVQNSPDWGVNHADGVFERFMIALFYFFGLFMSFLGGATFDTEVSK